MEACLLERQRPSDGGLDLGADLDQLQGIQAQICQAVVLSNFPLLQAHELQHRRHQALPEFKFKF